MNWAPTGGGDDAGDRKRVVQLLGPRPSPLSVNRVSRKIGKPPLPVPPYPPPRPPPLQGNREPVIIYAVSPKVIHTEASDFMSVVQRLTGLCSSSTAPSSSVGPISPAARMAVLEKASPPDRARATTSVESELLDMVDWDPGSVDFGHLPGILSPAPANLPAVMPEMFPSVGESQSLFGIQESLMSPWGYGGLFAGSPSLSSALFSGGATTMFASSAPSPVFDISTLFDY